MKPPRILLIVAVALAVLALPMLAHACPGCAAGLKHDEAGQQMIKGWFWSIMFMMSMPFLVLGGIGSYFYWEVRRARGQSDEDGQRHDLR